MPVSKQHSILFISKDESRYLSLRVFVLTGRRPKICDFHICANTAELFKVTARNGLDFLPAFSVFYVKHVCLIINFAGSLDFLQSGFAAITGQNL